MISVIAVVWDLCIDVETSEERLERFKKIDQGIVTLADIFNRLAEARCHKSARANTNRTPTPRRIPSLAKIAFAGGKG